MIGASATKELKVQSRPSSNIYFENTFNNNNIGWAEVYMLPHIVALNTYMRSFQYKILNNVLFINKKLHIFGIRSSVLCSFRNLYDEAPFHLFYECDCVKCLWSDLIQCFQNTLVLLTSTQHTAIFGILDSLGSNYF